MDLLGRMTLKEEKLNEPYLVQNQWTDASRVGKQGEKDSKNKKFIRQKAKPVKLLEYRSQTQSGWGMIFNVEVAG